MRTFNSLAEFALFLPTQVAVINRSLEDGLDRILVRIEKTAKGEFGEYQPAVGDFPAWPELADSTKADRVARGFSENDPLLRSGGLRASVTHQRNGLEGAVGSEDPVMAHQEFGTATIPARPVLGPAAFTNKDAIQKLAGAAVVAGLVSGEQVHRALGYDFRTPR